MSDLKLIARVAGSYHRAGPVVPFGPRKGPRVPTLLLGGRKYVLSTDGMDLGDLDDPADDDPRVIRGPVTDDNKWRYLWAYDTERQLLSMWRVSDGNYKFDGRAAPEMRRIVKLDKKGQMNRVTTEEMRRLSRYMKDKEEDQIEALKDSWERNKSDFQGEVDKALRDFLDQLRPQLEAQLDALAKGVRPLGWTPPTGLNERWVERSKNTFVISRFLEREFSLEKCEAYLAARGLDVNDPGHDNQAAQWARSDILDETYSRYLPSRPEDEF